MQRILVRLSHPHVFFVTLALLFGLAAATWAVDEFLIRQVENSLSEKKKWESTSASRIVARGKLVVGVRTDVPPFGFTGEDGQLAGFDIDLARELARRWLGRDNAVEIREVSAADYIPRLVSQDVDLLIAAIPTRQERDALVDFSEPYYEDMLGLLVRAGATFAELAQLSGRTVGVVEGSVVRTAIEKESVLQKIDLQVEEFGNYATALDALGSGAIDALADSSMVLLQLSDGNPGLRMIGTNWHRRPFGIAVPQGDTHLRFMVDFALEDMKLDGTYDKLLQKWFDLGRVDKTAVSPGEWEKNLSQLPQTVAQPPDPLKAIRERGRIRAGVPDEIAPFGFRDNNNQWSGFDIDVARELARRWLGDEAAVEFIPGDIVSHVDNLVAGELDLIAAGMIKRREWANSIDFSQTYLGPPVVNAPLGIAIPQNAPSFRELLNFTLQEMKKDGIYEILHLRWFGAERPVYPLEVWPGNADYLLAAYADENQPVRISAPPESTIKRIRQRGNVMRIGITLDAFPFSFLDETGAPAGFDLDLIRAIAERWGIEAVFVPRESGGGTAQLRRGEVDLLAGGMPHTRDREAELDFSHDYFINGQTLLLVAGGEPVSLSELSESSIAIVGNSLAEGEVRTFLDLHGINAEISLQDSLDEAIQLLQTGMAGGLVSDRITLSQLTNRTLSLALVREPLTRDPLAFGMVPGDFYFQQLFNSSLQLLRDEGVYEELYAKWFGSLLPPVELNTWSGDWLYTLEDSPTALARPVRSKIEEIRKRDRLRVGFISAAAPFYFIGEDGQVLGFHVDLVKNLAARWKGSEDAVEFVSSTDEELSKMLETGEVDFIVGQVGTHRDWRDRVAFSQLFLQNENWVHALGLQPHDDKFADLANFTLQEMHLDGTLERLVQRWQVTDARIPLEVWPGRSYFSTDLAPMISIPPAQFTRGYSGGFPDERTERIISLTSYFIDQYEVTNRQYKRCVRAGECREPRLPRSINFSHYFSQSTFGNFPVLWVSWFDAGTYCNFVGKRLPTEAEWEHAARGSQNFLYPWGNAAPKDQSNFDYIRRDVVAVGTFTEDQSDFGVYDMGGNVREWVADWYEWDWYEKAPQVDPGGPESGVTKVLRGGSWNDTAVYTRSTVRRNFLPESVDANLGFRCASSTPPLLY